MPLPSYSSTTAEKFAPGNFVTTWNPDLGRNEVGVTLAVENPIEANPRIKVRWIPRMHVEWVRAQYLYPAN